MTASYLCGLDIGGTFTDCVVIDDQGRVVTAKASSTPRNFADGVIAALERVSAKLGVSLTGLLGSIALLAHGTTVGTNTVIQRRGAKVGLITTQGHNDVIHIMRGSRGLSGQDIKLIVHIPESRKPDPLVPKRLIEGVSERVDCFGHIIAELNETEAEGALQRLLEKNIEALAICFLWSFLEPKHELRVKELAARVAPKLFTTCSSELAPKWGEYERTTAVALNAYIGPITVGYLARLDEQLKHLGYRPPLHITQCAGGTISVRRAMDAPLLTLDSGPVAGVTGSQYWGEVLGYRNIITTDMGGTSFDVGLIHDGQPVVSYKSLVHQYEYFLPKVDIQTMGSGGGSYIQIDPGNQTLRVGPDSAGADPGPVCYGRGGTVPTITDADLILGYLDAERFAGGSLRLDRAAAEAALHKLADAMDMDLYQFASGVAQIAEFQMADLIRRVTIRRGLDPREFVLFAFGGAGPVHMAVSARELGVRQVIVPQGDTASVWCAFGAAAADILHVHERVSIMASPFTAAHINALLADLKDRARQQLAEDGIPAARHRFSFSLDMRHRGQINEVEVELERDRLLESQLDELRARFVHHYEMLYGQGAALPGARLEIVTFRARAAAASVKPRVLKAGLLSKDIPAAAKRPARDIYWAEWQRRAPTPIYDGQRLQPGNTLTGPAVVETAATAVVVHPEQRLTVDAFGNFVIDLHKE